MEDVQRIPLNNAKTESASEFSAAFDICHEYIEKSYFEKQIRITRNNAAAVRSRLAYLLTQAELSPEIFSIFKATFGLDCVLGSAPYDRPSEEECAGHDTENMIQGLVDNFLYSYDNAAAPRSLWAAPRFFWSAYIACIVTFESDIPELAPIKPSDKTTITISKLSRELQQLTSGGAKLDISKSKKGDDFVAVYVYSETSAGERVAMPLNPYDKAILDVIGKLYVENKTPDGYLTLTVNAIYKELVGSSSAPKKEEVERIVAIVEKLRRTQCEMVAEVTKRDDFGKAEKDERGNNIVERHERSGYILSADKEKVTVNGIVVNNSYKISKTPIFYEYATSVMKQFAAIDKTLLIDRGDQKRCNLTKIEDATLSRYILGEICFLRGQKKRKRGISPIIYFDKAYDAMTDKKIDSPKRRRTFQNAVERRLDVFKKNNFIRGYTKKTGDKNKVIGYEIDFSPAQLK